MTPHDLATRHPQLFHVTLPGAMDGIRAHGLLPPVALLELFEAECDLRMQLAAVPRKYAVLLHHERHGTAVLNDQSPMTLAGLARCLDDGLTPADWLGLLNGRVFFWADAAGLARLAGARANRTRAVDVIVCDTLRLVRDHAAKVEISPINSGATLRRPARRGRATFTPLAALSYEAWSRRRGRRDRVLEVTVIGGVRNLADYITEVRRIEPGLG